MLVLGTLALLAGEQGTLAAAEAAESTSGQPRSGVLTNSTTSPTGADETLTITARKPVVEQGEKSLFTALPPRDLLKRPLTESPGLETATTVVGANEIEWMNAYTILDAMKYTPGAWTETRGRKEKQLFSVRGQRYPYPGYLVDGAWFREFTEASFFLNSAYWDRLEITRSSSDLLLTPGGVTGNINLVPRTYVAPATRLRAEYGSDNTLRGQFSHGDALGRGAYGLGMGYYHTDGPEDKNAAENVTDFFGRVEYPVSSRLRISLMGMVMDGDRELKLAEPPASAAMQTRLESFDPMRYYMLIGKARYELDDRAATELTLNYGSRRFYGHRVGFPDWLEEDAEYGLRLIQGLRLSEGNYLRFGGMYNRWESPTGKRFYTGNPGDLHTYAGVLSDEHSFGRLTLNAGYRFSRTYFAEFGGFNVEGSSTGLTAVRVRDEWEDPLHTVNVGGKYRLTDRLSLQANIAWGQIAARPGMLDVNLNRPGNETRLKYDLGLALTLEQFGELSLTGFYVDQQNAPLTASQSVIVNGLPFALYENADAESFGVELDTRTRRFESGLQFFFNATLMTTRRLTAGGWQDDPEVPDVLLAGGLSYLYRQFEAGLLAKHVGLYENDRFLPANSRPVDLGDFTELGLMLNYYFGKEREHKAFFAVDNLTDKKYSTVPGYPDEGRLFRGGLSFRF